MFAPDAPKTPAHKAKFSPEEDTRLADLVAVYGDEDWNRISSRIAGRSPRQCRDRWRHYLDPSLTLAPFTSQEDAHILQRYAEIGPKWKTIAGTLTGRTDIAVKNRWLWIERRQRRGSDAHVGPSVKPAARPAPVLPQSDDIPWSDEEGYTHRRAPDSTELPRGRFCFPTLS
jgi:hypothetical protein